MLTRALVISNDFFRQLADSNRNRLRHIHSMHDVDHMKNSNKTIMQRLMLWKGFPLFATMVFCLGFVQLLVYLTYDSSPEFETGIFVASIWGIREILRVYGE